MTGPRFCPEQGLLDLPPGGVEALGAWYERPGDRPLDQPSPMVSLLREIGAVTPHGVHPMLEPVAQTVARPLVRFKLLLGHPARACRVAGWFAPGWAVMALPDPEEASEHLGIVAVHPTRVPGIVATITELGPRSESAVGKPIALPTTAARALVFGEGGLGTDAVLDAIGAEGPSRTGLRRLANGVVRTWKAQSRWPVGHDTAVRELRVVDGGEAGLWVWRDASTGDVEGTILQRATPSIVWRHLTNLLPDADDFARRQPA